MFSRSVEERRNFGETLALYVNPSGLRWVLYIDPKGTTTRKPSW